MTASNLWLAAGLRSPFAKVDGALAAHDAIDLSVPVVKAMLEKGARPDFAVWGTVIPNLTWSNIAREVLLDAGADPTIPAFSTVMACSTSMAGVLEAAGMIDGRGRDLALVGGVEAMSRVQIGLSVRLSDWIRRFQQARDLKGRLAVLSAFKAADAKLFIPKVANRTTGLSMGEHTEITAKEWGLARADQDAIAFSSHQNAVRAWENGFFDDLVVPVGEARRDTIPRKDSTLEKLAKLKPAFDRTSGQGDSGRGAVVSEGAEPQRAQPGVPH